MADVKIFTGKATHARTSAASPAFYIQGIQEQNLTEQPCRCIYNQTIISVIYNFLLKQV
jgi:hypothetical protein